MGHPVNVTNLDFQIPISLEPIVIDLEICQIMNLVRSNFQDSVDFKVSLRLGLRFYRYNFSVALNMYILAQ